MTKSQLRLKYQSIRQNIKNKDDQNRLIFQQIITNHQIKNSDLILVYLSLPHEVDTQMTINYFINSKKIAVPKITGSNMDFYFINPQTKFQPNQFNILEPINTQKVSDFKNAVCLTPGLCFDYAGNRLGYGRGFYDKFLNQNNVYSIGLCFSQCFVSKLPHTKFDHKMDQIITSNKLKNISH